MCAYRIATLFICGIVYIGCCIFITPVHAENSSPEQQYKELTTLYRTAEQIHGLWIDVPELYAQAGRALQDENLTEFQKLAEQLQFMLNAGIDQAREQQNIERVPAYLR